MPGDRLTVGLTSFKAQYKEAEKVIHSGGHLLPDDVPAVIVKFSSNTPSLVGSTPERFGRLCKAAADFVAADAKQPRAVFVNAWNEWTEGSYLLPEEKHGTAYLKALKQAFGG